MIASREVRPPGVYHTGFGSRVTTINIANTNIADFVSIANKGPLDFPRLLQSWAEFVEVYGGSSDGYLARAVEGFFLNGGRQCYVVRVARGRFVDHTERGACGAAGAQGGDGGDERDAAVQRSSRDDGELGPAHPGLPE